MDEAALTSLHGLLHEGKDGIHRVVFLIEDLPLCWGYIFLLLCPVDGKILYAESFIEVGDGFGDSVDNVGHLVADNELDVLRGGRNTFAASWSPMKRPSFILIGPSKNSMVV
jgi:hypothetical protein